MRAQVFILGIFDHFFKCFYWVILQIKLKCEGLKETIESFFLFSDKKLNLAYELCNKTFLLLRLASIILFQDLNNRFLFSCFHRIKTENYVGSRIKVGFSPSKKNSVVCFIENPFKMMKNAFYFILKALFVLKIFQFLS